MSKYFSVHRPFKTIVPVLPLTDFETDRQTKSNVLFRGESAPHLSCDSCWITKHMNYKVYQNIYRGMSGQKFMTVGWCNKTQIQITELH